ncbi:MAG: hypothetical protein HYW23_00390 [Candidatus Aenigmarchaeota archaeon]|nr:hypothetical protein [Candidatus Aenigmarchaeota archaeon]
MDNDSWRAQFMALVSRLVDDGLKDADLRLIKAKTALREKIITEAKEVFQTKRGPEQDAYAAHLKDINYLSLLLSLTEKETKPRRDAVKESPLTYAYLESVMGDIVKKHGYISAKLVDPDPERARIAGYLLSRGSKRLNLEKDPKSKPNDTHFIPIKEVRVGKRSLTYDGKGIGDLLREYFDKRDRVDVTDFSKEYGFPDNESRHVIAMLAAVLYKNQYQGEGWEKSTYKGKTIYTKDPILNQDRVNQYVTKMDKYAEKGSRFKADDIDSKHPELVEQLLHSKIQGDGTFMEKENVGELTIRGAHVYYFRGTPGEPHKSLQRYTIGPDLTVYTSGTEPSNDYNDRIGR